MLRVQRPSVSVLTYSHTTWPQCPFIGVYLKPSSIVSWSDAFQWRSKTNHSLWPARNCSVKLNTSRERSKRLVSNNSESKKHTEAMSACLVTLLKACLVLNWLYRCWNDHLSFELLSFIIALNNANHKHSIHKMTLRLQVQSRWIKVITQKQQDSRNTIKHLNHNVTKHHTSKINRSLIPCTTNPRKLVDFYKISIFKNVDICKSKLKLWHGDKQ